MTPDPAPDAAPLGRGLAVRAIAVLAGLWLAGAGLVACSRTAAPDSGSPLPSGAVGPMASSLSTPAGTWATLPMGHLTQASNTFWQLLFLPAGAPGWTDQVTATDVATNGGLLLATAFGAPAPELVAVGIGTSGRLTFSPLIMSADGGVSWSDGLLPTGLAKQPSAFAVEPGAGLALVGGNDSRALASAGNLSRWSTLASVTTLAATALGRSCRLAALSAVGYLGGMPVVGGDCGRAGRVGLFLDAGGSWRSAGLQLPASLSNRRADVLALEGAGQGVTALVVLAGPRQVALAVASGTVPGGSWTLSPLRQLAPGAHLMSIAPAGNGGVYVLAAARSGALSLAGIGGAGARWQAFPPPPAGTAVVAAGAGSVSALAVHGAVLTVWRLATGSDASPEWAMIQRSVIPIPYGSSG